MRSLYIDARSAPFTDVAAMPELITEMFQGCGAGAGVELIEQIL
jgi:hypothetical protein